MSFQTPRSIEEMLTAIHKREYLIPAIQRVRGVPIDHQARR